MSNPKIKIEDDPYGNQPLLSRAVLTRGFNAYDDSNATSSMINESDLLDLESMNSPEMHVYGSKDKNNAHAMAAASIGFSSATPTHQISSMPKYGTLPYGTTPPVPESTSPFDSFLLNQGSHLLKKQPRTGFIGNSGNNVNVNNNGNSVNNSVNNVNVNNNNVPVNKTSNMSSSYSSPRPDTYAQRFLNENPVASTSSTPVGSYEYSLSPSQKGFGSGSKLSTSHPDDKQQLLLAERRRRRRESHNAVERRRRDNINEKIKELCDLLPEQFLMAAMDFQGNPIVKDEKPNKGTILSRSVDYIKQLQIVIDDQNRREIELHEMIHSLERQLGRPLTEFPYTSAEISLSKAGIGPQVPGATPGSDQGVNNGPGAVTSPASQGSMAVDLKSTTGVTPDNYTPEFDLDYYNAYSYGRHESALVDEEFGLSPNQ